ncbi:hypothetical protein [Uliginosibacterium sp. H1]|uniref:hypothetical protein n=1 Tax=Uliginosibacterium sp. H1 TaxID=3114757 RepID=UPI002E1966F6|nr:hypothetical protein [Uliginosibacterium sp. H1]
MKRGINSRGPRGFALLTVLILLTIMLLAGMALFRSADTAGLIAGNAAIKQAASQAGNVGLVVAQTRVDTGSPSGAGYSPTALTLDEYGIPPSTPPNGATWSASTSAENGYSYTYLIEKLCSGTGTGAVCARAVIGGGSGNTSIEVNDQSPTPLSAFIDMYRITVQITAPRGTTSYVQAIYGK